MKLVLLSLLFLIPQISSARIGETLEQCERRYGKPVKVMSDGIRFYLKNGVGITIIIWKGKVHHIRYSGSWEAGRQPVTSPFTWELIKKNFPEYPAKEMKANFDKGGYEYLDPLKKAGYKVIDLAASLYGQGRAGYLQITSYELLKSGDMFKRIKMKNEVDAKVLIEGF